MEVSWPLNILALSPAHELFFPVGSHLRHYIDIGFSLLNENYEIDQECLRAAEEDATITGKTLREYARAHTLAVQFLGAEHEVLKEKLEAARERKKIPTSMLGIACLAEGGIENWIGVARLLTEKYLQDTAKLQKERLARITKRRKESSMQLQLAEETAKIQQEKLAACLNDLSQMKSSSEELRLVLRSFTENFRRDPLEELANLIEYIPLTGFIPDEAGESTRISEYIRGLRASIIKPTALLFDFPERSHSGRKISYDEEFLHQVSREFSNSQRGMSALRDALTLFSRDLDKKKLRQAKRQLPFELPEKFEARDAHMFSLGEKWVVFFLWKAEKRLPAKIRFLQKKEE